MTLVASLTDWLYIYVYFTCLLDFKKFQIGLPLKEEEEEEKNHDENIEADIPRENEPVKIAARDLGLQLKINI